MIKKILIANRGEIACRIIRTAKKLGIKTAAVYSESDVNSLAVQNADEAYFIGPSPSSESYLDIKKIIDVIHQSGADAVHPGYGFLSENAKFVKSIEKEGVKFIGPSVDSIKSMGDKIQSKKIAKKAKVNTVPGYLGVIENYQRAEEISQEIGFPVMVKASAGGGGRGMRVVWKLDDVKKAYESAAKEAKNNFNDDRLFIEKFIENPRHIEIQILGDQFGNVVCLGERECSIQRYNQKIIEEAPSCFVDDKLRKEMYAQSVRLAKEVGYFSAGTVEYIVDQSGVFYFLEMNTRLQVEHCVTELITGVDLVEQMINVANGKKLGFSQKDIKLNGWAIEGRICAEDPARGFLPSSGRISNYVEPKATENVRVDSGVYEGDEVSVYYDPMIAKLCSYAKNRKMAIDSLSQALSDYVIKGVSNNINFLQDVILSERFVSGNLTTGFINEEYPSGYEVCEVLPEDYADVICVAAIIRYLEAVQNSTINGQIVDRRKEINNRMAICIGGGIHVVEIDAVNVGAYNVILDGRTHDVVMNWRYGDHTVIALMDNRDIHMAIISTDHKYVFNYKGKVVSVFATTPKIADLIKYMPVSSSDDDDATEVCAPISGKVLSINVKAGDVVEKGALLFVVEAMKMENSIYSEQGMRIKEVFGEEGGNIQVDDLVIAYEGI
jgi:propionyl-CoA carboxylase alpha chain